jgi:hypothetical protein
MANFSDRNKRLASGQKRKEAGSPASKPKNKTLPERDQLSKSELNKVTGGMREDPCAGGQNRRR